MSVRRIPTTCPPRGLAGTLHGPAVALKFDREVRATGFGPSSDEEGDAAQAAAALWDAVRAVAFALPGLRSGEIHPVSPQAIAAYNEQFPQVNTAMSAILSRTGNPTYLAYMRVNNDFRRAVDWLFQIILNIPDDNPAGYQMKKSVVQFLRLVADTTVMLDVVNSMDNIFAETVVVDTETGKQMTGKMFAEKMLRRFITQAYGVHNDAAAGMAAEFLMEIALL